MKCVVIPPQDRTLVNIGIQLVTEKPLQGLSANNVNKTISGGLYVYLIATVQESSIDPFGLQINRKKFFSKRRSDALTSRVLRISV